MATTSYDSPRDPIVALHRTIEIVVTSTDGRVLLMERTYAPCRGLWVLPGGFVDSFEAGCAAAVCELAEKVGMHASEDELTYLGVWNAPGRDPRGRFVSVAYHLEVAAGTAIETGDDTVRAEWWPLTDLPQIAFDHADIIRAGTAT